MLVQNYYDSGTTTIDLDKGRSVKLSNLSVAIFVVQQGRVMVSINEQPLSVSAPGLIVINDTGDIVLDCQDSATIQYHSAEVDHLQCLPSNLNFATDLSAIEYTTELLGVPVELGRAGRFTMYLAEYERMPSSDKRSFSAEVDDRYVVYGERGSGENGLLPAYDVVVIGAATTGISVAAHCIDSGLSTLVLGEPLSFWKRSILPLPLRSPMPATDIASPRDGSGYLDFAERHHLAIEGKIDFKYFIAYFQDFLLRNGIKITNEYVTNIRYAGNHFMVDTMNKGTVQAKNVVVATGICKMKSTPRAFASLPKLVCVHSSEINSISGFESKDVVVIGGGQSAVEMATEIAKVARNVHLIIRGESIIYRSLHSAGKSLFKVLFVNAEKYFKYTPASLKTRILKYLLKGTVEPDLREKIEVENITVHMNATITGATMENSKVTISLPQERRVVVDKVVLGSGYKYDLSNIGFLESLVEDGRILKEDGFPVLDENMQTNMPGLFFTGYPCINVIGPKAQFISGTSVISPRITKEVLARVNGA